ncbi:hypothetical protein N752_30840 [Desulforamulus aquiferis]|nr:NAD-binding protein [Desulforamulus aquiferis]RYD01394.1 hypothetical protein N752_30840 [Desulforamulus aquiferis]
MKKSILIVGVGRFGRGVIEGLYERGHDIFAIDKYEEHLDEVRDLIVSGAILDVGENDDDLIRIVGEKNLMRQWWPWGRILKEHLLPPIFSKKPAFPYPSRLPAKEKDWC